MAELTPSGFERRNRTQILEDVRTRFRDEFGQNVNLDEDSVMGKLAVLVSELRLEQEKLAEEVHASQTLGGAEGIYLDDLLSKYGVFRQGPVAGEGYAHILYTIPIAGDGSSTDNITIDNTYSVSAQNGRTYTPAESTVLANNTTGLLIRRAHLVNGRTYQATIIDTTGSSVASTPVTYDGSDSSAVTLFNTLATFVVDNTTGNAIGTNIFVDSTSGSEVLYVGYSQANEDDFIGLSKPVSLSFVKAAGQRWGTVLVTCNTKGFFPVNIDQLTGISPQPTGFQSIVNTDEFDPGENTETDAEFKDRYFDVITSGSSGTKDGIITALRNLEGVDNVRVYDNPTEDFYVQNNTSGDLTFEPTNPGAGYTVVAEPLTFNAVVKGGTDTEIAQGLYDNKPINVRTFGANGPFQVVTADATKEDIYFTEATDKLLNIKITYTSGDGIPLSATEQTTIKTNIQSLFNEFDIGDIVYNTQVVSATLSSLTFDRVKNIEVQMKATTDPTYLAVGADYSDLAYNEVAVVQDSDIIITRAP